MYVYFITEFKCDGIASLGRIRRCNISLVGEHASQLTGFLWLGSAVRYTRCSLQINKFSCYMSRVTMYVSFIMLH